MSTAHLDPRRKLCRCTASNLADAIASLGYNSRRKYSRRQLGLDPPQKQNEYMSMGNAYEPIVGAAYSAFTGNDIELKGFGLLESDERFGASPDYEVTAPDGEKFLLEVKTTSRWKPFEAAMPIPINHILQMIGQCMVFGYRKSHYISHHLVTGEFYVAEVTFTQDLWDTHIYPKLKYFMDEIDRSRPLNNGVTLSAKLKLTKAVLDGINVKPL